MEQQASSELVKRARELERLMARRRVLLSKVRALDELIRQCRRFLHGLSNVTNPPDVYVPPVDGADVP